MNIKQNITKVNRTVYNNRQIKYIVVHYFGAFGSAQDNTDYYKNLNRQASAHYFVDDYGIVQCVEDKDASWHCGDKGPGRLKGICTNANSIGVEVRPYKINKTSMRASDNDWYFHEQTIVNTIALIKHLMLTYNIDIDHVVRHYDVTAKWCPRPFTGNDINVLYHKPGNQLWEEFKSLLVYKEPVYKESEEDDMDGKTIF